VPDRFVVPIHIGIGLAEDPVGTDVGDGTRPVFGVVSGFVRVT
jgi:hypothetical protein